MLARKKLPIDWLALNFHNSIIKLDSIIKCLNHVYETSQKNLRILFNSRKNEKIAEYRKNLINNAKMLQILVYVNFYFNENL